MPRCVVLFQSEGLGKRWKANASKVKANDDNRVLFRCAIDKQKLTAGQLFKGVRLIKADASEVSFCKLDLSEMTVCIKEEMCRSKEDIFNAQKAFQIIQRLDPTYLPHFRQVAKDCSLSSC
jgi:hypothetical protein